MESTNYSPIAVHRTQLLLKYTYGLLFIVAGADKFTNLITHWGKYASPLLLEISPLSLSSLMVATAVFEICLGISILSPYTRWGAYVCSAWLLLLAADLISTGIYFDIAARDVAMAIGALSLAWLSQARK